MGRQTNTHREQKFNTAEVEADNLPSLLAAKGVFDADHISANISIYMLLYKICFEIHKNYTAINKSQTIFKV